MLAVVINYRIPYAKQRRIPKQVVLYLEENPRGKHGQIVYDLQQDFGMAPATLGVDLAFYYERFPARQEES